MQRGRSSSPGRQLSGSQHSQNGTPRVTTFDSATGMLDGGRPGSPCGASASRFTTPGFPSSPQQSPVAPPSVTVAPPSTPLYVRDWGTATASSHGGASEDSRPVSIASGRLPTAQQFEPVAYGPPTTTSSLSRSIPGQVDFMQAAQPAPLAARPVTTVFRDPYPSPASPWSSNPSPATTVFRSESEARWNTQAVDIDLSRKPWPQQQNPANFRTLAPTFPSAGNVMSPPSTLPRSAVAPPKTYAAPPSGTYAAPFPTYSAPPLKQPNLESFLNEWEYCDLDRIEINRMEGEMLRFKQDQLHERLSVLEHLADSVVNEQELYDRTQEDEQREHGSYESKDFGFKFSTVPILPDAMASLPREKRVPELEHCIGHYVDRHRIERREQQLEDMQNGNQNHPWILWLSGKTNRNLLNAKYHVATKSWRQTETFRDMYEDGSSYPVAVR